MFKLTYDEMGFIALCLEGFFYGVYSGIFAMYVQYQTSERDTNKTRNIIFYSICSLYVLSVAVFVSDTAVPICALHLLGNPAASALLRIYFIQTILFGCCDFIAQFILIYRCWIVWGRNTHVVVVPSILAFTFLGTWLSYNCSVYTLSGQLVTPVWGPSVLLTSLALSLAVNALVTGLIVFRIFKVFLEVKATSDQTLAATGGRKLRHVIFILIESGMALFSIQLARLVITIMFASGASYIVITIHQMLNGITPTIILVRTSMGLSFNDEKSMEEVVIGSLRFASNHPNSVLETGSINNVFHDDIDIQLSNDIDIIER